MSAALERIINSVVAKSERAYVGLDTSDEDCLSDISVGGWKDAITVELHSIKTRLEKEIGGLVIEARQEDALRDILKDL